MMEFPGRTQSRRLWAFTTQEIGPAGIAGKAREKALPEPMVSGHSQVSVPESLLWDWPRVLTRAPPSTPPSLRGTSHHPCPLVFNSSKLCCPSPVCSPAVPLPTEWHLLHEHCSQKKPEASTWHLRLPTPWSRPVVRLGCLWLLGTSLASPCEAGYFPLAGMAFFSSVSLSSSKSQPWDALPTPEGTAASLLVGNLCLGHLITWLC